MLQTPRPPRRGRARTPRMLEDRVWRAPPSSSADAFARSLRRARAVWFLKTGHHKKGVAKLFLHISVFCAKRTFWQPSGHVLGAILESGERKKYLFYRTKYPVRAEHVFPPTAGCLFDPCLFASSLIAFQLSFAALARLGGRLRLPGALRRLPRFARRPRFARPG